MASPVPVDTIFHAKGSTDPIRSPKRKETIYLLERMKRFSRHSIMTSIRLRSRVVVA